MAFHWQKKIKNFEEKKVTQFLFRFNKRQKNPDKVKKISVFFLQENNFLVRRKKTFSLHFLFPSRLRCERVPRPPPLPPSCHAHPRSLQKTRLNLKIVIVKVAISFLYLFLCDSWICWLDPATAHLPRVSGSAGSVGLKSLRHIKYFCCTCVPLASTRWVRLTLSSLCPLFSKQRRL